MEAAKKYGYKKGDFSVTEKQSERIISLPIQQNLTEDQISYVINCIYDFYKL
jgi:dTDP-4-amino-4,6-dideoxygalactose transaminase